MIIKTFPDKEKALSILRLVKDREDFIKINDFSKFLTIKAENYYEVIKELMSVLILLEGFKSTGENAHKDLINFIFEKKIITEPERILLQDLRIKRNQSFYEGKQINPIYLENNEKKLLEVISDLKDLIEKKL